MGRINSKPSAKGNVPISRRQDAIPVERVQTGVRIEKRLLKVLKGLAEFHDLSVGDLLEGIVLHAFEGKCALSVKSLQKVRDLKKIYELDFGSEASHRMEERDDSQ
jgi:hypothetical protein